MAIPKTHKAAVYSEPGTNKIEIKEVETPKPGPGEVLVHLTHSGVCHSDYSIMMNAWDWLPAKTAPGQVGGHEGAGEIVELGEGVTSLKLGERVGIKWIASACMKPECPLCSEGSDQQCPETKISGFYYPGTFQQYVVAPARYATPIPNGVSSEEAAPIMCGGVTVFSGLRRAHLKPGQWVVVSGASGGLGHMAVQYAKADGYKVIAVDHGSKKSIVVDKLHADAFVDFTQFDDAGLAAEIHKIADGRGAHAVIVCNASKHVYDQALNYLRNNGTLVCVGLPEHDLNPIANAIPAILIAKTATITGSAVGNYAEAIEAVGVAASGKMKVQHRVEPLENLQKVFDEMAEGKLQGRVVLDLS